MINIIASYFSFFSDAKNCFRIWLLKIEDKCEREVETKKIFSQAEVQDSVKHFSTVRQEKRLFIFKVVDFCCTFPLKTVLSLYFR